jgi:hypothetical protein
MARAIDWAIIRGNDNSNNFLVVNTGSNYWNYQIKDLALAVKEQFKNINLSINENALPDKRSYQVDFSLFNELAPQYVPTFDLEATVKDLRLGMEDFGFNDSKFRESHLIRLNVLREHLRHKRLNKNLEWLA